MSYDISIIDPETKKTIEVEHKHTISGGTYALGGTKELWLNITYNYGPFYYQVFGDLGIESLYGKVARDTIPILKAAIKMLIDLDDGQRSEDYWAVTPDNARKALEGLLGLAFLAPSYGVWDGD